MERIEDGRLLRILVGEDEEHGSRPLYEAIVFMLRREGVAGATVMRGIMGFGASSLIHTSHVLRMSEELPIVIECVDRAEKIEAVLPRLDEMISEGLVTIEKTDVRLYRGRGQAP